MLLKDSLAATFSRPDSHHGICFLKPSLDYFAMETHRGNEQQSESKPSSTDSEQSCANAVVKLPSDSVDEMPLEPPPSGKFRRTALRFFGGRKSICVLPSFFGGRSKNQSKWPSKKGVSKSKTHDGLSKASWEDSPGNLYVPAGDLEFHGQKDSTVKTPNSCSSEFGHPVGDQKSLSLPRQKKGLRGLFSSIRRHKKNKYAEFEKNEMVPMSYVENKEVPVAQVKTPQNSTECLGSVSEPNVPDSTNAEGGVTTAPECFEVAVIVSEKDMTKESLKSGSEGEMDEGDRLVKTANPTKSDRNPDVKLVCLLDTEAAVAVNSQPPVGSSDQINMIFGDVASLKSFDSLTGCGDIIADQDDDSIADSTVSGERSRNAGKRSSCCVTYQGGGEDMATPDEVDRDYLQDLWESEATDNFAHEQNPSFAEHTDSLRLTPEEPSSSHRTDVSSIGALGATENTVTSGDLLTPQSDHQESVPNSDEGYYDSTTPGPDEEGHDKSYRMKRDRLPRDSYSGDALYELFGPDDSLISPAFENQFKLSSPDAHRFLDVPVDVKEHPAFGHEDESLLELEKPGLTKQSMCQDSKEMSLFTKGLCNQGLSENMSLLNSKTHASFNNDLVTAEAFSQKGNMPNASHALNEKSLKHSHSGKFGNPTFSKSQEHRPEKNKLMVTQSKNNKDITKETTHDLEDDLTVCFSQALVDFTKHSTEGMRGSESSSPFAQNMQALPAIVTFDVVDMDNEGEYDQQIDVTIEEEDISSPYEVFEESYLQKDAFAECDDRMFDFYEQSLLCNTWAIASLPRHLSLTRVNQSMPSPLALNRRSRSLDTDSLELDIADIYVGGGATPLSYHRTERDSNRVSSLHRKKNGHTSATSDMKDGTGFMCLSWQPDAERTMVPLLSDGKRTDKAHGLCQAQIRHASPSSQAGSQPSGCKAQQLSANMMAERVPCLFSTQNTGLMTRPCHLPLQSEATVPQVPCSFSGVKREDSFIRSDLASDGGGEGLFYSTGVNSQSYSQCCKMRPVGITQGMPHSGAPSNPSVPEGDMGFIGRVRKPVDTVYPPLQHTAGAKP